MTTTRTTPAAVAQTEAEVPDDDVGRVRMPHAESKIFCQQGNRHWPQDADARAAFVQRMERRWTYDGQEYDAMYLWTDEVRAAAWSGHTKRNMRAKFGGALAVYWALTHEDALPVNCNKIWNELDKLGGSMLRELINARGGTRYDIVFAHVQEKLGLINL